MAPITYESEYFKTTNICHQWILILIVVVQLRLFGQERKKVNYNAKLHY